MTAISTAAFVSGQNGYARLFQIPKWGQGNTSGTDLDTVSNNFKLRYHPMYSDYGASVELMMANWASSGTAYCQLTASTTTPRDLEVVVEETSSYYILLVKQNHMGGKVQLDLLSQTATGFLMPLSNDPFTYVPSGKLIRPMSHNVSRSATSTGANASQYARIATVTFSTITTSRTFLLAYWDIERLSSGDSIGLLSVQFRQGTSVNSTAPTVSVQNIAGGYNNSFKFFTRTSTTSTTGIVDLYVLIQNTYSTFAYSIPFEDGNGAANNPSISFPYNLFPSTTMPGGTLVPVPARRQVATLNAQTLSSNGAVTIDASTGDIQHITLAANATSSSITNATIGQRLTIAWYQDATGSRTYVWPSNVKFAGNAAPTASTTAAYRDRVSFYYDGTYWEEDSRAVAVR